MSARWADFLSAIEQAGRSDAELAAFAAGANCRFRVVAGERAAEFSLFSGSLKVTEARSKEIPFSLEAPAEVWRKFFSSPPPAFYHGVYAMKMRVPEFRVTGDELALAQNIHLVRRLLEIGRELANGVYGIHAEDDSRPRAGSREPLRGGYVWIDLER